MKKKTIMFVVIIIVILLCVLIGVIGFINMDAQINIEQREYKKFGDNLYYTDELIENKGEDRDTVLNYCQIISDYMKENFNCDIYINHFNKDVDEIYFYGYQIIDEVIIVDTFFTIIIQDNMVSEFYSSNVNGYYFADKSTIDTNGMLSVENIKEIASKSAEENADTMLEVSNAKTINGEMYLEYDEENNMYYKVDFDNGSYIQINAMTGEIIDTFYFDGIIT